MEKVIKLLNFFFFTPPPPPPPPKNLNSAHSQETLHNKTKKPAPAAQNLHSPLEQPKSQKVSSDSSDTNKFFVPYNFNDLEWDEEGIDFSNSDWDEHSFSFCSGGCGTNSGCGQGSSSSTSTGTGNGDGDGGGGSACGAKDGGPPGCEDGGADGDPGCP